MNCTYNIKNIFSCCAEQQPVWRIRHFFTTGRGIRMCLFSSICCNEVFYKLHNCSQSWKIAPVGDIKSWLGAKNWLLIGSFRFPSHSSTHILVTVSLTVHPGTVPKNHRGVRVCAVVCLCSSHCVVCCCPPRVVGFWWCPGPRHDLPPVP